MAKKKWLILPAFLLLIQFFRPSRSNNPDTAANLSLAGSSADVHRLLKAACLNCHSNQTNWPWYSAVAPVSWFVADDVNRARREVNFSEWERYKPEEKAHLLREARELIEKREMPPWSYRLMHSEARLSEADIAALVHWTERERQKLTADR
ncbi:MAG: hypothetical protein EHM61_27750 [Acidobacteria bacterium]|nr:MAG: hypothetical protein EHM61_27750 [Acidobacteriota bacterium]